MATRFSIILKNTLHSTIPLLFGGLIAAFMSLMDGFFLIHYDRISFNALVLVIPVITLVAAMCTGIGVAFADSLLKAKCFSDKIQTTLASFFLAILINTVITILCICLFDEFLAFNNFSSNTISDINSLKNNIAVYWFWIIPTYWAQTVINVILQFLTIKKQLRKANLLLVLITVCNLIMNPILIFYYDLGIKGAAIATCIAFIIGVLYFLFAYRDLTYKIVVAGYNWMSSNAVKILLPSAKKQVVNILSVFAAIGVFSVGQLFFNQFAVELGARALIIFGISEQLKIMVTIPSRGVTGAYLIQFGNSLKNKATDQYFMTYWASTLIIGVIYLSGCSIVLSFPDYISDFYNISEANEIAMLKKFLQGLAILFFITILPRASQVAFINLEKGYLLFLQSLLLVVSSLLFTKLMISYSGVYGLIEGQILGMIVTFIVFFPIFLILLKNKVKEDLKLHII